MSSITTIKVIAKRNGKEETLLLHCLGDHAANEIALALVSLPEVSYSRDIALKAYKANEVTRAIEDVKNFFNIK